MCVHVILGMPGESRDDMMATARTVAADNVPTTNYTDYPNCLA